MIKRFKFLSLLAILITSFAFTACNTNSDPATGTMKVSLTDAPAAYDQVNIEIRQIKVNKDEDAEEPNENGEDGDDGEGDDEDNGWYSILDDSITVNLLDYQNGETLELGQTNLDVGQYNQIRLILGDGNNVVIDGETYALSTPSAQQSGYKLLVNATVEEDQVYNLVIDFDASQSIVKTGNNTYQLKPVLRTVDLEEQASISGTVLPLEAEPYVYAIFGEDTVGTQPDNEGNFRIIGLEDNTYKVSIKPTNDAYADSLIEGIELEEGEQFEFEETIELKSSGVLN